MKDECFLRPDDCSRVNVVLARLQRDSVFIRATSAPLLSAAAGTWGCVVAAVVKVRQ